MSHAVAKARETPTPLEQLPEQSQERSLATRTKDRVGDCLALTKPRVTLLVVLTAVAACYVGAQRILPDGILAWLALGTGLLAGGTAALNQLWERRTDALMARTSARPLPAGRVPSGWAMVVGGLASLAGFVILNWGVNGLCAAMGAATMGLYLLAYTPLKFHSPISTLVGAFPGAGPILMGWAAARGRLDEGAWILFGIQFLWQFPHFLAIAWLYKEQYQRAGIRMLPVVDVAGRETARQVLLYSLALLPVSLLPTLIGLTGTVYFAAALALGVAFLLAGTRSVRLGTRAGYRQLLQASVIYLPLLFAFMAFDRRWHP